MEDRRGPEHHFVIVKIHVEQTTNRVTHQGVVTQHDPLGKTRRSAGVKDAGQVLAPAIQVGDRLRLRHKPFAVEHPARRLSVTEKNKC